MDDIAELVALPDRSVQPLVHPLDVAEAKGPFRAAWLIELVTGPPVGLAIGAIVWELTANILLAAIAAVPVVVIGSYAGGRREDDAWSFIPRSRQDRERVLPSAWELAAGVVDGAAFIVAAVLVADRLSRSDIADGIAQFVIGAGLAVVVLVAFDLVMSLVAGRGTFVGRPWFGVPIVVALFVALALGARLLFGDGGFEATSTVLLGAASVMVAGVAYAASRWYQARRRA